MMNNSSALDAQTTQPFHDAEKRRGSRGIGLRLFIFMSLFLVSVAPVGALYKWIENTSFQRELDDVEESHLIIAENLSGALSRYANDLLTTFNFLTEDDYRSSPSASTALLDLFNVDYMAVLAPDDSILSAQKSDDAKAIILPSKDILADLRRVASERPGVATFSRVISYQGTPHFFAFKTLADGNLAFAPISTDYLVKVQKAVSFGELGHAMIVDHVGQVVAHPNAEWQATSKDASPLSVVQKMISGQTGVMQFYSPPLKADMIAGYTFVPETGWGVMVPQPVEELRLRAISNQSVALTIVVISIVSAIFLSWLLAYLLSRPISRIVGAIKNINDGETKSRVGQLPTFSTREATILASAFDEAMDNLEARSVSLSEALVVANQANVAKTEFITVLSHEMRTPLNGIIGSVDLLRTSKLEAPQAKYVDIIDVSSQTLLGHVNDVLDVSRLETGNFSIGSTAFDLRELLRNTIENSDVRSRAGTNRLSFYASNTIPAQVMGDPDRVKQVIENLINNAIAFTDDGQIVVRANLMPNAEIIEILVSDTGIGIDKSDFKRIFENFVAIDSSYKRSSGGTGLGLGIARRIVEAMGGEIGVESTLGQGSHFWVHLPLGLSPNDN